jgi:Fe-Mn family superoxide dismutase
MKEFLSSNQLAVNYRRYQDLLDRIKSQTSSQNRVQLITSGIDPVSEFAAQVWNLEFFWSSLSPVKVEPTREAFALIVNQFGSFGAFQKQFEKYVENHWSNGWIWLAFNPQLGLLTIIDGQNGYNPLRDGYIPILGLDLWEVEYFIDYRDDKLRYVQTFWKHVNWNFVNRVIQENITASPMFYSTSP